jgi:anti-sigma-K factor RskA
MSQSCFTSEVYALYAIGSLDGEERNQLESHMGRGCDWCRGELGQARLFWSGYAAAVPPAAPRPALRRKILAAVAPRPPTSWWMQAAAAVLLLSAGIGLGWMIHRPPVPQPLAPQVREVVGTPPASGTDEVRNLQAKIDQLNARAADREKELQAMEDRAAAGSGLEKNVAALQAEAGQRMQLLQEAQDRSTQLAAEVERLRGQAAAAEARSKEMGERYQTAANQRAEYAARIRALETENQKFQRVIDEQQRQIRQHEQMVAFFASPNLRFYQYKGTKSDPAATAHVIAQEGGRVLFYAFHMPQLVAGRTYQLWLIRGQSPAVVSGGIFHVDREGNAVVEFTNPALTRDVRQFAVTDEPAAGSPGPTGNQYFRAS